MKTKLIPYLTLLSFLLVLTGCENKDEAPTPMPTYKGLTYKTDFYDTDILIKSFRVYSKTNISNDNKTIFSTKLPSNTVYWTYWFVVKQGQEDPLAYAVRNFAQSAAKITPNPVVAFGLGLIANIPALQNNTETLDLYITNRDNTASFLRNGKPDKAFTNFGFEENAINTFRKIEVVPQEDMYFCVSNDNISKGLDAYLHIVAFVKK